MAAESPNMNFNINITLDKKKGVYGVDTGGGSSGGSPQRGESQQPSQHNQQQSHGASSPVYHTHHYHGVGLPPHVSASTGFADQAGLTMLPVPKQQQQQQQQQHHLRELYAKFTLYQHKLGEVNNELLEVKGQLLKKEEEVLARDQIIAVLTHTVKMKEKECETREVEISRLKTEATNLKQLLQAQVDITRQLEGNSARGVAESDQLRRLLEKMQEATSRDLGVRDKVILEQIALIQELARRRPATPAPTPAQQFIAPAPSQPSQPVTAPSMSQPAFPTQPEVTPATSQPQVSQPDLMQVPSQMYQPCSHSMSQLPSHVPSAPHPADKDNAAIHLSHEELGLQATLPSYRTPMQSGPHLPEEAEDVHRSPSIAPQPDTSEAQLQQYLPGARSARSSLASISAQVEANIVSGLSKHSRGPSPASKQNTAITVPGDVPFDLERLSSALASHRSTPAQQPSSRPPVPPPPPPANKRNTAIEAGADEISFNSQF